MSYYDDCCLERLRDLVEWVSRVYPGQTINGDYVFHNARLRDIAKGSQATHRIITWCRGELEKQKVKDKK